MFSQEQNVQPGWGVGVDVVVVVVGVVVVVAVMSLLGNRLLVQRSERSASHSAMSGQISVRAAEPAISPM